MLPRPPKTPTARAAARAFLGAVLALAVAAGAVPFGPALGAHGCSMPCCKDANGQPGECEGGSCPVSHFGGAKAEPTQPPEADHSHHAGVEAPSHDGAEEGAHHAGPGHASPHASPHAHDAAGIEHSSHEDVPPRDTSNASPGASAALSKPCPPDCGGLPTSSTQLRRGRDEAALSYKLRPRPPDVTARARDHSIVTKDSSALRRQYPPRAPPTVSDRRPV